MLPFLIFILLVSPIFGLQANPEEEEDYDFGEVAGLSLNDSVLVFSDEVDEFQEAAVTIMLDEIEQLKNTVGEKEEEIQQLHSQIESLKQSNEKEKLALKEKFENEKIALVGEWETKMNNAEQEKIALVREWEAKMNNAEQKASLEKANYERQLSNKNILTRFLSFRLRNNEKKARISRDVIEAQNKKLHFLGRERKTYQEKNKVNLKQAYLQAEAIMKLEAQKAELKEALRHEVKLQQDYCNLTNLIQNDHIDNFPSYVTMMTKSLVEQSGELDKLRSFLDDESQIQIYMTDLLEEMKKLNETFNADIEDWDLLERLNELVKVQSESLISLKPTISYIVNNNSGFEYEVNEDGLLKSISPCQCLPNTNETGFSLTGIQFQCPTGQAVPATQEESGISLCSDGRCPETFTEDLCVDKRTLWSEWTPCRSPNCLVEATRSRNKGREVEAKGVKPAIIEESSTLNVTIPEGYSLSVFAIGGGGGFGYKGSSRGGYKNVLVDNHSNQSTLELTITVGEGGDYNTAGGLTTIRGLPEYISASGASYGGGFRSVEPLPDLCGTSIAWGTDGSVNHYNDIGQGGVIVDGRKPTRQYNRDGEGFGAGGGYNKHGYGANPGYKGVVVLSLCKSV